MGRSRYAIIEPDQPHFLTCTVMEWLPLLAAQLWWTFC
jgi:putative transposase